jgi:transposase-like protein
MWISKCRVTGKARSSLSWSKKGKHAWTAQIDKILALYARGMTTRDIQAQLQELYGVEVSPTLISNVTEAVMDEVRQWQTRPLEPIYPIIYVDCLVVKVCENQRGRE